jgi:hypothetical protein
MMFKEAYIGAPERNYKAEIEITGMCPGNLKFWINFISQ